MIAKQSTQGNSSEQEYDQLNISHSGTESLDSRQYGVGIRRRWCPTSMEDHNSNDKHTQKEMKAGSLY